MDNGTAMVPHNEAVVLPEVEEVVEDKNLPLIEVEKQFETSLNRLVSLEKISICSLLSRG
jgi:hypothetical protein